MSCLRQLFGVFLALGGFLMTFFAIIGPGSIGHILLGKAFLIIGLVMLFYKSKK